MKNGKILANIEELSDEVAALFNDATTLKSIIDKLAEENQNLRTHVFEIERELSLLNEKLEDLRFFIIEESHATKTYAKAVSKIELGLGKGESYAD